MLPILAGPELALIIVATIGIVGAVIPALLAARNYQADRPEREARVAATAAATEGVKADTASQLIEAANQVMGLVKEQQAAMKTDIEGSRARIETAVAENKAQIKALTEANASQVKAIEKEASDLRGQTVGLRDQVVTLLKVNTDLRQQVTELTAHSKTLEETAKVQAQLMAQFTSMRETLNKIATGVTDVKEEQQAARQVGNGPLKDNGEAKP